MERTDEAVAETTSIDEQETARAEMDTSAVDSETIKSYPIGLNEIFGILSNQRRRRVLRYLDQSDGEITLSDLAESIAAEECGKDVKQITSQERKRVYVGLYQCHLPKLDGVSAISYNKSRGKVEQGDNFDLFGYYLPDHEGLPDQTDDEQNWTQFMATLIQQGE